MKPPEIPLYDGTFHTDIDGACEVMFHYEFLNGTDRVTGAMKSLISYAQKYMQLEEFWRANYDKLVVDTIMAAPDEVKEEEVKKKKSKKKEKKND